MNKEWKENMANERNALRINEYFDYLYPFSEWHFHRKKRKDITTSYTSMHN